MKKIVRKWRMALFKVLRPNFKWRQVKMNRNRFFSFYRFFKRLFHVHHQARDFRPMNLTETFQLFDLVVGHLLLYKLRQ